MVKLMIVDTNALVRCALETRLSAVSGFEIMGSTGAYSEAPAQASALAPDVVLLEIKAPDGLETLKALVRLCPQGRVIVLTTYCDTREEDASMACGAAHYLLKSLNTCDLVREIRNVACAA